ncbi:MAG: alpha-amylase family glycosyl hydrolase, partial [Pseudomonadota bacterium]
AVNPYNFQNHLYAKNRPENLAFLRRVRALMDEYPAAPSVGEVGEAQRGMEIQAEYTAGNDLLHMCYGFDFLSGEFPTPERVAEVMQRFEAVAPESWACWAFSNHDVVRHASRWGLGDEGLRVYAALLLSLKGSVCLYQGEELGLTEAYVSFEDLQDPYGKRFWPKFRGRDGCRTPMPWVADNQYGGFSDTAPWLPMAVEHLTHAAANQVRDESSMLNFYGEMIAFRRGYAALAKGGFELVAADEKALSFIRRLGDEAVFCAFNLSAEAAEITLPEGTWQADLGTPFGGPEGLGDGIGGTRLTLAPWQAFFAQERG